MKKNDVTVIIPVYNGENFIERSILSVLNQSKPCDLLIINDGSIDQTDNIIKEYLNKYDNISSIKLKSNRGVSNARNIGINKSQTTYISFLDSDDTLDKNFIVKMYNEISKDNSDICYCGSNDIRSNTSLKKMKFSSRNLLINYLKNKTTPNTNSWMIKKSFLLDNNIFFQNEFDFGEDMLFFGQVLLKQKKTSYVPLALSNYYLEVPDSLSKQTYKKIDSDIKWCKELSEKIYSSEIPWLTKRYLNTILYKYRLSASIITTISESNISNFERKNLMIKYKRYIKPYTFCNGLRSLKGLIKYYKLVHRIRFNY